MGVMRAPPFQRVCPFPFPSVGCSPPPPTLATAAGHAIHWHRSVPSTPGTTTLEWWKRENARLGAFGGPLFIVFPLHQRTDDMTAANSTRDTNTFRRKQDRHDMTNDWKHPATTPFHGIAAGPQNLDPAGRCIWSDRGRSGKGSATGSPPTFHMV